MHVYLCVCHSFCLQVLRVNSKTGGEDEAVCSNSILTETIFILFVTVKSLDQKLMSVDDEGCSCLNSSSLLLY